ncbi:MAG TPA: ATP-binding cassette domain-containing protein, partial [Kofleriaceae bacterium]
MADLAIDVRDLRKTYRTPFTRKKVEALRGVTFGVERGHIFGFVGPNGAGKTTTIRTLMGLIRP